MEQTYEDLEILVHESGEDARVAAVVSEAGGERTRHIKTVEPVSMAENWERAVHCASGDYITFLGDDDGLLPDACSNAAEILNRSSAELLSWELARYFWPKCTDPSQRNRLTSTLRDCATVEIRSCRDILHQAYRFHRDYTSLPMIYNSFVSRAIIERACAQSGSYFLGLAPDLSSGIVNAFRANEFLFAHRPLSISGVSQNSTGHRMHFSGDDSVRHAAVTQAFSAGEHGWSGPRNLKLFVGKEMLAAKQRLFPRSGPDLHYRNWLWCATKSLDESPWDDTTMVSELREIAAACGVAIDGWLHPRTARADCPPTGIRANDRELRIDVDCRTAGISNVHEATRFLIAILGPAEPPRLVECGASSLALPVHGATLLDFRTGGKGVPFLGSGWSEPEDWGIWSISENANLSIAFEQAPESAVTLRVEGRTLLHSGRQSACGVIRCNGRLAAQFESRLERPLVSVEFEVSRAELETRELEIEVEVASARSPAQEGISSDPRRLGFGLHHIEIKS